MQVILYCRVSTDEQADGCSLDMQERILRAYCEQQHYTIIGEEQPYKEDYSAKHHDLRRPKMRQVYEYCKRHRHEVDKVLFLRWDRFTRNLEFALTYKRKFYDELGIEINAIESPIDFRGTEWSMLLGMYCGVAHTEDEKISRRTKDGIHGTLLKGKCANKAPRGYKNVRTDKHNTHVEIDEDKAKPIREAFNEVAKGIKCPCSVRRQVCPHIPESSFLEMLRNVFYIGKVRVPAYGNDPEQIVSGEHEPLIDEETFYKVQEVIDGKRRKSPKLTKAINPDLYLRKFLVCPKCGHALTGATSRGNGGRYTYYNCCENAKHLRIRAEEVNEGFARYVSCLKPNQVVLDLYKEVLNDIRLEDNKERNAEISKLKEDLSQINKRANVLEDKYLDGEIEKSSYQGIKERLDKESNTIEGRITTLESLNRANIEPKLDYAINLISNLGEFFRNGLTETKIQLLGSMFPEKIELDGKKYRTKSYNKVLDLIYEQTNELRGEAAKKEGEKRTSPQLSTQSRDRTGTPCGIGV